MTSFGYCLIVSIGGFRDFAADTRSCLDLSLILMGKQFFAGLCCASHCGKEDVDGGRGGGKEDVDGGRGGGTEDVFVVVEVVAMVPCELVTRQVM